MTTAERPTPLPAPRRRRPVRELVLLLLGTLLAAVTLGTAARAQTTIEDGGRFGVRTAWLEPSEGVYHLNANLDLALSRSAMRAVREGVPVLMQMDIVITRHRRYVPNEGIASLAQRWQLQYHALSARFLLNNLNSGQQTSYSTLDSALAALAQLRGVPVLDAALIEPGQRYEGSVRFSAAVEGGLPSTLRLMMFWIDWRRTTDWYVWTIRP